MHLTFIVDAGRLALWQVETINRILTNAECSGSLRQGSALRRSFDRVMVEQLERLVYRLGEDRPLARCDAAALGLPMSDAPADLTIDLTGSAAIADGLVLGCGGLDLESGAIAAIITGEPPQLTLDLLTDGHSREVARWLIGVEDTGVIGRGVGFVFGRAVEMLELAVAALASGTAPEALSLPGVEARPLPAHHRPLGYFCATFARRVLNRLPVVSHPSPRWMTAWRFASTADDAMPDITGGGAFTLLADDGQRFYADPFVFRTADRTFLFVEDYPYATGRGVISAVEMTEKGPAGRPEPVLETDCHLSYPFVFEHAGELFMLPETSGRCTVELWRAERFPDRWVQAAVLLEDVDMGDATLISRDGRWFLLGAERPRWCSSWDGLSLWTADQLSGPWRRVGEGPVKVDVSSARPAGRPFTVGDRLMRPFQDSVGGYGAGLGFAEIERCDGGGYAERIIGRCRARPPVLGPHTYNRGSGFEVIDIFTAGNPETIAF